MAMQNRINCQVKEITGNSAKLTNRNAFYQNRSDRRKSSSSYETNKNFDKRNDRYSQQEIQYIERTKNLKKDKNAHE